MIVPRHENDADYKHNNHSGGEGNLETQLLLKNYFRHILYFDNTLDKTGIGTLLVDEDDIKRASESLMHFDKFLHEDNQANFLGEWIQALMLGPI